MSSLATRLRLSGPQQFQLLAVWVLIPLFQWQQDQLLPAMPELKITRTFMADLAPRILGDLPAAGPRSSRPGALASAPAAPPTPWGDPL